MPIRLFYPKALVDAKDKKVAAPVYMHGGGYTVGSVDEFENGLRLVAENSGAISCDATKSSVVKDKKLLTCKTIGAEYHLAPEHRFPTQIDEYSTVVDWVQGSEGAREAFRQTWCSGEAALPAET